MPLLLLPYTTTTQALSATTAQVIHGSAPYFTFDNGATKFTTTDGLLWITLSDGTHITPAINTSATTPIVLPNVGETLADVQMLVPTTANSIPISTFLGAPYNYWGDDDGDGQGTNGVTATGNLTVSITDKDNQVVSRSARLDICKAPYKVVLTSTAGSLTTQYGLPNSSSFSGGTATYYISPKAVPTICYARPNLQYGKNNERIGSTAYNFAGPATIWNPTKGFLVQSTTPSSYSRNFPTTGANNLYFDLDIGGVKGSALTWPTVSQEGITATMTPSPDNANNIRVTLTGPFATASQQESATPGSITRPTLPQTFVLVGKDSSNNEILSYGFVLRRWFVNHGRIDTYPNSSSWCSSLGGGYRMVKIKDLTNAVCPSSDGLHCSRRVVGATPSSSGNNYQRNIGAGFFTEWGFLPGFGEFSWTSQIVNETYQFTIRTRDGHIYYATSSISLRNGICVYP